MESSPPLYFHFDYLSTSQHSQAIFVVPAFHESYTSTYLINQGIEKLHKYPHDLAEELALLLLRKDDVRGGQLHLRYDVHQTHLLGLLVKPEGIYNYEHSG